MRHGNIRDGWRAGCHVFSTSLSARCFCLPKESAGWTHTCQHQAVLTSLQHAHACSLLLCCTNGLSAALTAWAILAYMSHSAIIPIDVVLVLTSAQTVCTDHLRWAFCNKDGTCLIAVQIVHFPLGELLHRSSEMGCLRQMGHL
eukprot:scaffold90682_cov18-Tisochrysis_lutea.AAC.1